LAEESPLRGESSVEARGRMRALVIGERLPVRGHAGARLDFDLQTPRFVPKDAALWDVALLDGTLPEVKGVLTDLVHTPGGRPATVVFAPPATWGGLRRILGADVDGFAESELEEWELLDRIAEAREAYGLKLGMAEKAREGLALAAELGRAKARMAEELRLAGDVQRSLHPPPRRHPGLDIGREFIPAREIGGDYYDFVPTGEGRLLFAVGDVMGKGVPAALLAANLKASLRAQLRPECLPPGELLASVNRLFCELNPRGRFSTLFVSVFCFQEGKFHYANAGHPPPFVVTGDGGVLDLEAAGPALGLMEDAAFPEAVLPLGAEDLFVFFSDGVTDRTDRGGNPFGLGRLKAAARSSRQDSARIALYSILGELQGFSGGAPADDDITLILTKVRGASPSGATQA
jgi:serine phosphatase RsbU (regulator of sigma subunit)